MADDRRNVQARGANQRRRMTMSAALALLLGPLLLSACSVQPLYGTGGAVRSDFAGPDGAASGERDNAFANLPIFVQAVQTRPAQLVRNELIFLINGGRSQDSAAPYRLEFGTGLRESNYFYSEPTDAGTVYTRPAATRYDVSVDYRLIDPASGDVLLRGTRSAFAETDRTDQLYAARSAERDAVAQAAREAARQVALALTAEMRRDGLVTVNGASASR